MRFSGVAGSLAIGVLLLAGCAGAGPNTEPQVTGTRTVTSTLPPTSTPEPPMTVTVTQTTSVDPAVPSGPASVAPSVPITSFESLPAATAGECPYITNREAAEFNGQGVGQTYIRPTKPYVVCDFYRSDGGWSASVRVIVSKDAAGATRVVDEAAPIKLSGPVEVAGGWSGGSWVKGSLGDDPILLNKDELAIFAVAKGKVAVFATSNEPLTKKTRNFVEATIKALDL